MISTGGNRLSTGLAATLVVLCVCVTGSWVEAAEPPERRNVIVMVADGAGFNTWAAASMFDGTTGREIYDAEGWVRLAASVHSLRRGAAAGVGDEHANQSFPNRVYDPERAWDATPIAGGDGDLAFEGYRWLVHTSPDSASTATALASGRKTYDGALNVDGAGQPVEATLAAIARRAGRRVGVVTSVPLSHATPAAFAGVHDRSRSNYCEIAVEMLTSGYVDLIAGAGNPGFDNNGDPIEDVERRVHEYVGGADVWEALNGRLSLTPGQRVCSGGRNVPEPADHRPDEQGPTTGVPLTTEQVERLDDWKLVQRRSAIEGLVEGATPERLLIVPEVGSLGFWPGRSSDPDDPFPSRKGSTLQQHRGSRADPGSTPPGFDPPNAGVPSLETLTRVALNVLDDHDAGFLLHVEGGAVDWAMHANQMGRMIEELTDFKRAIRAVVEWVDAEDAWDETLLIVTADHDHMLWGPDAESRPFDALKDRGKGKLPGYRWLSTGHSNALVPVYARGSGAEALRELADRDDPFRGAYLDQTDIYRVLTDALQGRGPD